MPRKFEEYLEKGVVRKVSPDKSKANFFIEETEKSFIGLTKRVNVMGIDEYNANSIVKECYDIIMEIIRSKMLLDGYKASGNFAHEAEVSYLKLLNFSDNEVSFVNELRYSRNSIVYYGKLLDIEYAEKTFHFLNKLYPKLKKILPN